VRVNDVTVTAAQKITTCSQFENPALAPVGFVIPNPAPAGLEKNKSVNYLPTKKDCLTMNNEKH